ncbi:MAG: protein kinase [Leptospiraceae bacterium]|nr:MAG: protein kinase [Leptospiraceae bacterium]
MITKTMSKKEVLIKLAEQSLEGDKFSLAKIISIFENTKPEYYEYKNIIIDYLKNKNLHKGYFLGITGTPGAGKSTLTGKLALELINKQNDIRVAILAVDPSSEVSGGSLLGDRTRVKLPINEKRIYFRSQASDKELGGLSKHTFNVCRVLYYLFDYIFLETVGIGQSEIEIQHIADHVFLVLQPLTGDQIQFMKAGIMEIPDAFIINKWDQEKEAQKTYYALKSTLSFIRPNSKEIPIFRVSAYSGFGINDLIEYIISLKQNSNDLSTSLTKKEIFYFEKWVKNQYGLKGLEILNEKGGASTFLREHGSFDLAIQEFSKLRYTFDSYE